MARSHGVVKVSVWTPQSEFRTLTKDAQRAYVMLLSQPQINNCGVLPYTPKRWARYATNDTLPAMTKALLELGAAKFIVTDIETGELLVRTFVKHDKIADQPNLAKAAIREYGAVESDAIRGVLAGLYPWLTEGVAEPLSEPLREALREPLPEPLGEGGNAHTRAAPTPSPTPEEQKSPNGDSPTKVVYRLFEHWKEVWNHPTAILNAKRSRVATARLNEGYTETQMRAAIDGSRKDSWPDRTRLGYHDFDVLFRDGRHVEDFAEMNTGRVNGSRPESEEEREQRIVRELAARGPRP